jgi:hypothetical protein
MLGDDLGVFFADWGEAAAIDGGPPILVIHGAPGEVLPVGAAGASMDAPRCIARAADVPHRTDPDAEMNLVYAHRIPAAYWVREVLPCGTGLATLVLAVDPSAPD